MEPAKGKGEAVGASPLGRLRALEPRLADVLEATVARGDVLAARARLLLVLLRARCPLEGPRRRTWYVPGAIARLGVRGLARAWTSSWPSSPAPSERRLRGHLAALERDLLLVRAPGDWIPRFTPAAAGPRRYRWPDTFHVLESDEAAEFWSTRGVEVLAEHPDARTNPTQWRQLFGDWRGRRLVQRPLFVELGERLSADRPGRAVQLDDLRRAEQLRRVVQTPAAAGTTALLAGLEAAGCPLRGRNRELARTNPARLRGAAAVLAGVLSRGRSVRNASGFLVAVWRRAPVEELAAALEAAGAA